MAIPIHQVDAFCAGPFTGNPAAVCPLSAAAEDGWMQAVAAQLNLSETAFTWSSADGRRQLRWFTPTAEVDLCGHATVATAHVLYESGVEPRERELTFETRFGPLGASAREDATGAPVIQLRFPALAPTPASAPEGLAAALGAEPLEVLRSRFDLLAVFETEACVRALTPDFRALLSIDARGVIATAPATGDDDFVSRFFGPAVGVDEDPVTGSAHCVLGPYWSARLGRSTLSAWQASARGGRVGLALDGDQVLLTGRARTVWRGELLV